MKIIFAGYRTWAIKAFEDVIEKCSLKNFEIVSKPEDLNKIRNSVILGAGWSWIIPPEVIEGNELIALMHPSDLPKYSGGSPIQHQIIDGLTKTMGALFQVDTKIDAGPIFLKKEMSLTGNMDEIFESLRTVTCDLMSEFIVKYPDIKPTPQEKTKERVRKRLKPEDSRIAKEDFQKYSTETLYNMIRCRENPYPNVYVEDDHGRLYISSVRYEKND